MINVFKSFSIHRVDEEVDDERLLKKCFFFNSYHQQY